MNIRKIIYLNCRETNEDMIDRRSYAHNLRHGFSVLAGTQIYKKNRRIN